jgi:MOSC domain-containing protein YiiM
MMAHIAQVNVSQGGVPKRPIPEARIDAEGLRGDKQNDRRYHGGPDRAGCLFAIELIEVWAEEGHPIAAGCAGENITTRGLDWSQVVPGAKLRLGAEVVLAITDYAVPCKKNAGWFRDGDFMRMSQKRFPGRSRVYARVLSPGTVRAGDPIVLEAAVEE